MKTNITDIALARGFEQYSTNSEFLGVERIEEYYQRDFNGGVVDTPFGSVKPSRTVKVVHYDGYTCKKCKRNATYVTYQKANENGQIYMIFWVRKPSMFVPLTKDHIHAKSLGGTDAYDNLQSLCYPCNQEKSDEVVLLDDDGNETRPKKILDAEIYREYKKKISDFKYLRKRIKRFKKRMPWYMKLVRADKYLDESVIQMMQKKGYFIPEDEED